jgi:hypothetical protein
MSFPQAPELLLFFADIFAAQGAAPVSLTRWQIEKIFNLQLFATSVIDH